MVYLWQDAGFSEAVLLPAVPVSVCSALVFTFSSKDFAGQQTSLANLFLLFA